MKDIAAFLLRLVFSLFLVWLLFHFVNVDFDQVGEILSEVNWGDFWILIPILLIDRILMSYKWNILLRAIGIHMSLWQNIRMYMASGFIGLALPASVGADLVRTYQLKVLDFDASHALASIVVERVLGIVALLFVGVLISPFLLLYEGNMDYVFAGLLLMVVAAVAGLYVIFHPRLSAMVQQLMPKTWGQKFFQVAGKIYGALKRYQADRPVLLSFFIWSVLEVGVVMLAYLAIGDALKLNLHVYEYIVAAPIILLIARMPISANGIGVVEAASLLVFGIMGVPEGKALTMGLLLDISGILAILPGVVFVIMPLLGFLSGRKKIA